MTGLSVVLIKIGEVDHALGKIIIIGFLVTIALGLLDIGKEILAD